MYTHGRRKFSGVDIYSFAVKRPFTMHSLHGKQTQVVEINAEGPTTPCLIIISPFKNLKINILGNYIT